MEFSSQRRETLLFLITIIYYNMRSGPILAASIHSFLRCRAIIGPLFTFRFPAKISLKKRNKKRAWSQVKLITHSWRKRKKTEPSLTMNLTLTIVHKTKKTNQHRGWAIKPLERPWLKQPWYIDVVTHFYVVVYRQLFTYEIHAKQTCPFMMRLHWCHDKGEQLNRLDAGLAIRQRADLFDTNI